MNGNTYGSRRTKQSSGGAILFFLFLGAALLVRYGESERLVQFRQTVGAYIETMDYEEAIETIGRGFREATAEDGAIAVFGREILGFEKTETRSSSLPEK